MQKGILEGVEYNIQMMNFLLFCPTKLDPPNPPHLKSWLPDIAWGAVQSLTSIELFEQFSNHLEKEAPSRFKDWYNELTPETEKLPLDWKKLESMPFEKLLVIRCLRPDRITTALDNFIRKTLPKGDDFVDCDSTLSFNEILYSAYSDSTTMTPIYFILSPGSNPVRDVEELARALSLDPKKMLHTVALGQG